MAASASPPTAQQLMQQNQLQRQAVLSNAVEMQQSIANLNIDPTQQTIINIQPRPVGLVKGFLVEVTATLTNGHVGVATRTGFGSANLVRQFQYTDLNNNNRIISPGWHIATINSARQGWVMGGAYAPNVAMGYGNNWDVNSGPATIAIDTDAEIRHIYWVPLAYSGNDLRGAIYSAVVNSTQSLQITLNPTPIVAAGADGLNAIYTGNATGGYKVGSKVNISVYQVYLDQLPVMGNGPILPILDLNTVYEIKQTAVTGMAVGQDFPYSYANYRDFLSTVAVFDNGGTFNVGSDVNYWALQAANYTNLWKLAPEIAAFYARQTFMADPPAGVYYFNHRDRPINSISYGNMELVLNASAINANAQLLIGTEAFAQINQLVGGVATSLSAG
jgi:hypothetical protein